MKKFGKIMLIALIVMLFVGTFGYLFKRSQPKEIHYQELTPVLGNISKSTVVTGKINEVIAKLKVIPDMNQLASAQSRVRLSEVNLEQAQANYDREKALYDKKLVSADEYEKIRQSLKQAKEEHAIAKEALEIIRDGVSSSNKTGSTTLVRSTISGLILDVPVKVGNSVINSNTFNDGTTIATVANMNDLIFDGNIDETEVGRLHLGLPVRISVGALQDLSFDAALEYIAPKATENNGTNLFEIKASVKVPADVTIRSGYSANAEIVLQEVSDVITLPESAIQYEGEQTFVYVKNGKEFERREVKTGLSDGVNIEIKSGLSLDDVVRGPQIITTK